MPGEAAADGQSKDVKAGPHDPGPDASTEQSLAELMFQFAVSNGLLLVLVPAFVRLTSGAGLADLGLHRQEWPRQMGIGVRAAMLMTPPVCAIQFLTIRIWRSQTHPVEQMVLEKLTVGVAILAVLSTMVLAPLIEELLFRGIFQRWLGRFVEDRPLPTTTIQEKGRFGPLEPENESFFLNSKSAPTESTPIDPGSEILAKWPPASRAAFVAFLESADTTHLVLLRGHASFPVACTYRNFPAFNGTGDGLPTNRQSPCGDHNARDVQRS